MVKAHSRGLDRKIDDFPINAGLHQGSSTFLFIVVLDVISEPFRGGLLWELMFADDLALMADNKDELQKKKGLKVNTGKAEVMVSSRRGPRADIRARHNARWRQVDQFQVPRCNGARERWLRLVMESKSDRSMGKTEKNCLVSSVIGKSQGSWRLWYTTPL
ncbi:uncharacterized protein LOC125033311 [Penaeus chinensis]|uniref:uncharacterized protein LOC125033311 n=1 Tax=Penaeus chinensis TaxID=139456 RepID=UPI001FB6ACC6|nr:uncharacterized protein LOC125033311 [Penaeus chinensis]